MAAAPVVTLSTPFLTLAQSLRRQFSSRPSLQDVAVNVLQHSLGERYRWLNIDSQQPLLMEPVYAYDGQGFTLQGYEGLTLVDALIERCATEVFVDYSQGQFVVRSPAQGENEKLSVDNRDLEQAINEHGALLIERYKEALISYWMDHAEDGKVRYLWLAQSLKHLLLEASASAAITHEQLDMVAEVIGRTVRPANATVRAYIVDHWGESGAMNQQMLRGLVIVKQRQDTLIVLLFTLSRGIQAFDSLDELGGWLVNLLSDIAPGHHMQWRLYEPAGDVFQSLSLTYLATQLSDIQALMPKVQAFGNQQRVLERALRVVTSDFDTSPSDSEQMARLRNALPGWLLQADPEDQRVMSDYVIELAQHVQAVDWKPFDHGIVSPGQFACQALAAQLAKDFPDKPRLDPDRINLQLTVNDPDPASRSTQFWHLPPRYTQSAWTLTRFAWLGAGDIDPTLLSLGAVEPEEVAVWLQAEEALKVIQKVDVRAGYSRLVEQKLRDDHAEVRWRKTRFIEQVRLQLPMLALEYHLKYPAAFSRQAYANVCAVLQPSREGETRTVVLRPLALKATADSAPDKVVNMFVIGPRDVSAGSHVLYRPMSAVKFIEFERWEGLLATLMQPGPLQYQVLAWLPDLARSRYLKSPLSVPGVEVFAVVDFNTSVWSAPNASLAQDEVEGDYLEALFLETVQAMSGREATPPPSALDVFWGWIKDHFGLGLALILPLLGGPYGKAAGWLLLAWSAWQDIKTLATDDAPGKLASVVDLLLAVALVLLSRGRVSTTFGVTAAADTLVDMAQGLDLEESFELRWHEAPESLLEGAQTSRETTAQVQLPTVHSASSLVRSDPCLEQSWSGLYTRLSVIRQAELALYKVQAVPTARRIDSGAHRGLYGAGHHLYANIGGDWFKVQDHAGVVHVINDAIALREGPEVQLRGQGEWVFVAEPVQLEDFQDALARQQQHLAQLNTDQARREQLNNEYATVSAQFEKLTFTEERTLQQIGRRINDPGIGRQIDGELAKAQASYWCAITLLDALESRRRMMLVKHYSALNNRFSAGAVKARRAQAVLYEARRRLLLKTDDLQMWHFDAQGMQETVLDPTTWQRLAPTLSGYSTLQASAVEACLDAERRFEQMKQYGRAADVAVAHLDVFAWTGRRMSLKWQELQLRTLALSCFCAGATVFRDGAFDLIREVTSLCSLKLMSLRELFCVGRFSGDQQLRMLNDALDTLVLAHSRLSYELGSLPSYINAQALGRYRTYVRTLFAQVESQLLDAYREYEHAGRQTDATAFNSGSLRLIEETLLGRIIGNHRQVEVDAYERVDVMEPFDYRRLWSFKNVESGAQPVWNELKDPSPPLPTALAVHERLAAIGGEASRLWRQAGEQYRRISSLETIRRMSPLRVRSEWLVYANRMITQRDLLIDALRDPPASAKHSALLDFFRSTPGALYDEILGFLNQGSVARNRMAIQGAPTSDALWLLYKAWMIEVVEVPAARLLVREFEVRERSSGRPLWFARLHYNAPHARDTGIHFTRGTLKRYTERDISYAKLKQRASNNELLINVLRSNIDHEVAKTVFFGEAVGPLS